MINRSKKQYGQSQMAIFSILIVLVIITASSLQVKAYENGVYWICKDIDKSEYPYQPIDPTTIIYGTDEQVYLLFVIEYVTTSHSVTIKWYDNEDKLYDTNNHQIPHPASEDYEYYTTYSDYGRLPIKGEEAANLPGEWKVELYIDGNKEVTEFFEIRSTTTTPETTTITTPTTTTTSSPPPLPAPRRTIPQEEMPTTSNLNTTTHQEAIAQTDFLSNLIYPVIIILAVIIVMIFIVLATRKKPITTHQMELSKKHCIHCGEPLKADETFCGSCGEKVE